jgi:iron complex outermembrane receptor protein
MGEVMGNKIRGFAGSVSFSVAALMAAPAGAQDAGPVEHSPVLDVIVVTGSRLPADLSSVPGSVTVIGEVQLEQQADITSDLPQILAQIVPGYGVTSFGTASNFDQTMRGRKPAVLIDGVPVTVPLSDGGRDMRTIGASAVGQIEVIRGATALYGLGGAGGLINYITKTPGEGPVEFFTELGTGASLTHVGDSFRYNIEQGISGRADRFSFVATGSYEQYSSLFDADGDRIAPDPNRQGGIADNGIYNLFGKLGYDLTETQTLQMSINKYVTEMDTDYHAGVGVFGVSKTPALKGTDPRERNQFIDNLMYTARYTNADVWGSALNLQGYYSEYSARFSFFPPPTYPPNGGQSTLISDKRGLRLDIATPVSVLNGGRILWGADLGHDETAQVLTDGRVLVPYMRQTTKAGFVQFELDANSWLKLRGGVRYENVGLDIPTFTTIALSPALPGGVTVQGGDLDYSDTVYNIGAVFNLTQHINAFVAYSEGFSVAELGRILRTTTAQSVSQFRPEAQIIDNYEVGVRLDYGALKATVAAFRSTSDLGSTYNAITLEVSRAKEKTEGYEATIDWDVNDHWRTGATYSYVDGDRDSNGDGRLDLPLDTTRIGPTKLTGYLEYAPAPSSWMVRLQGLYSGSQDRFPNDVVPLFGRAPVPSYTLIDLTTSVGLGRGRLALGIQNLLNESYFTPASIRQASAGTYSMGVGRTATLSYRINY